MTTSKSADNKALQTTNKAALNCFPKAALIEAINHLADSKNLEGDALKEAGSHSLAITKIAADFGSEAHAQANDDTTTVLTYWKDSLRAMALELAAAGSPFAEASVNKAGETVGKLTGTGNNVLSIAKGVVDFRLNIDECANEEGEVSYRSVRATVEAKRAERRAEQNPEMAALADAKEAARDSWKELSKVIFDTNDIGLINDLATMLDETREVAQGDIDKQIKAELEALAAKEKADEAASKLSLEAETVEATEADAEAA